MIVSLDYARENNLKFYFTGNPCKRGHIDKRRVDNKTCESCARERNKRDYAENAELHKERSRIWRAENKERVRDRSKKWAQANPKKVAEMRKRGYEKNKEKILKQQKEYYERNRDWILAKQREDRKKNPEKYAEMDRKSYINNRESKIEQSRRYAERNKEAVRARQKEWYKNNQDKVRAGRWRRKATIKNAKGKFNGEDVKFLLESQKGKCVNCLKDISKQYEVDHIQPLFLGGSNCRKNIQLLCKTCNRSKWAKDPISWAQENGRLL